MSAAKTSWAESLGSIVNERDRRDTKERKDFELLFEVEIDSFEPRVAQC